VVSAEIIDFKAAFTRLRGVQVTAPHGGISQRSCRPVGSPFSLDQG
jgi:hypothetical protein